jgi:hypothetical protein
MTQIKYRNRKPFDENKIFASVIKSRFTAGGMQQFANNTQCDDVRLQLHA